MTNENIVIKIQPNYREYLVKAVYAIIPLSIALIGVLVGIMALMNGNEEEMLISLGVFISSDVLTVIFAGRFFAFYIKSNKAKKTLINITENRIFGTNANLNIDVEISNILSVNVVEASIDIKPDGTPKTLKVDLFSKMSALYSKYLNIRTNDGKNIYIDCVDECETVKNTIDAIRAKIL